MKNQSGKLAIALRAFLRSVLLLCVGVSLCAGVAHLYYVGILPYNPLSALAQKFPRLYIMLAALSVALFCFVCNLILEKRSVLFRSWVSPDKSLTIQIRRGDILTKSLNRKRKDGTILLGINEKLEFGDYSPTQTTLLNQVRGRLYRRNPRNKSDWLIEFFEQKRKEYCEGGQNTPIGTIFPMDVPVKPKQKGQKFLIAVMSHATDAEHPQCTTLSVLKQIYTNLFSTQTISCINDTLYCPLLGKGSQKDSSVSTDDLLLLAAKTYIDCAPTGNSVKKLVFVVRPKTFASLNVKGLYSKLDAMAYLNCLEQKSRPALTAQPLPSEYETAEYQILHPQFTAEEILSPEQTLPVDVVPS